MELQRSLVSVVIPCYKQAHFLPKAIESVLAQTYPAVEAIVVDDGSPDDTRQVASRYPAVRYLRQHNQGRAEARNAGFRACGGEYVIFLDADDRLTPVAVESHLRCLAADPNAGFVVGDLDHITSDGSYSYSPRWPLLTANHYEELLKANHVANTMAVMFRRSVLEEIGGFDPRCEPAEDYEMLLRAARCSPSRHHHTVVAQYRRHGTNTSRQGAVMLHAMHHVMESQRPWVQGVPRLESARQKGAIYWRDHFGAVAIKEVYNEIRRGHFSHATHAVLVVASYVRGRLVLLPWKNRRKFLKALQRHLGLNKISSSRRQV
jgi:glycosyltransferase involved in cell wall biosynthesis